MCYVWVAYAAAAAIAGASAIQQGRQQKAVAEYNAKLNAQAASDQAAVGIANEFAQREKARRMLADQTAAESISGFVSSTGTPLLVAQQTAKNLEFDVLNSRYANQQRVNAFMSQSQLDTYQGKAAVANSYMSAGTALLSGAAQAGAAA